MWTIYEDKSWDALQMQFDWVRRMHEVPQDPIHHAEGNVAIHTQMVLAALENDPDYQLLGLQEQEVLWASALLHDVEKYSTTVLEAGGSITSNGHARKGAAASRQIIYKERPAPFAIREQVVGLVRYHGLPLWIFEKSDPLKALVIASMEVNTMWLSMLARADARGRICQDLDNLLYRIDCFEEFCKEQGCWGTIRSFGSGDARMHYLQQDSAYVDYVPFESPQMDIVLMSGLPGAGKDTFIRNHFAELPVISLDDIRKEWGIKPTDQKGNGRVIQEAKMRAKELLRKKKSFVWNATNTTFQMRQQLINLFTDYRAAVNIIYIESSYAALKQQNKSREEIVPEQVLERLIRKLEVPALWEAHVVQYHV